MAQPKPYEVRSLQYLRGVSALGVVFYHTSETYHLGFDVGAAGVDVFFVISGFVMWITTFGRSMSPGEFFSRRLARVVPLYWIVLCATAVGILLKPAFFFGHDGSPANLLRSFLFIPSIENGRLHPTVVQGWTLSYELFFYAVFAVSLSLSSRARAIGVSALLVGLALLHLTAPAGYPAVLTDPIILEFVAGLLLGAAYVKGRRLPAGLALAFLLAGVAALALANFVEVDALRPLVYGVPAALIAWGCVSLEMHQLVPEIRSLHLLGDASYSIYLWHIVLGALATGALLRLHTPSGLMPLATLALTLPMTLAAYVWVEKPLVDFWQARRKRDLGRAPAGEAASRVDA